ncbi:MAG: D-glycerate dehydrogenase [Chloroflexi bacterium]|nr:D-glycerate dehydrogenase [Chloroflexota bacterium]
MSKPTVFVTRIIPEKALQMVREHGAATVWEGELPPSRDDLLRAVAGADGLLCLLTDPVDADVIDAAPRLRVISQMAVGYDNIDLPAATRRRIPVGHTPGVLTDTTADFAFALLMAAARRISEAERFARAGRWKTWGPTLLMGQDVYGATLGIVGMGRIGQAVARRARGFEMRVLYADPSEPEAARELGAVRVDLDDLLAQADFVSLHVPLTAATERLIDARALARMKPTAILVNTARGPVVDRAALYDALVSGQIAYAALDVTDPEPIAPDDPLLSLDNCLIVPHIASSSVATRTRMAVMAAENLIAGLKGDRLPHCANPQVYG